MMLTLCQHFVNITSTFKWRKRTRILGLLAFASCSAVSSQYQLRGYTTPKMLKRIAVVGWTPADHPGLGATFAHIGADFIKLRKNYLIYKSEEISKGWESLCTDPIEGVVVLRTLDLEPGSDVKLCIAAELYRCSDGALVWRVEGRTKASAKDPDLKQLTQVYRQTGGQVAEDFAAPAFVLLQDLLNAMPNPVLNDDEIMEKIGLE